MAAIQKQKYHLKLMDVNNNIQYTKDNIDE